MYWRNRTKSSPALASGGQRRLVGRAPKRLGHGGIVSGQRGGAMTAGVQFQALGVEPHLVARLPRGGAPIEVPAVDRAGGALPQLRRPKGHHALEKRLESPRRA